MEQISAISMRAVRVEGVDVWRMVHKTAPAHRLPPGLRLLRVPPARGVDRCG